MVWNVFWRIMWQEDIHLMFFSSVTWSFRIHYRIFRQLWFIQKVILQVVFTMKCHLTSARSGGRASDDRMDCSACRKSVRTSDPCRSFLFPIETIERKTITTSQCFTKHLRKYHNKCSPTSFNCCTDRNDQVAPNKIKKCFCRKQIPYQVMNKDNICILMV